MTVTDTLVETARAMVAPKKGILAIDETSPTCTKRFTEHGIESTEETRRVYREMFVMATGAAEYISSAILFDETIRQKISDGRTFAESLMARGMIPGIKVDKGTRPLEDTEGETVTVGLEGLAKRLEEYRGMGARFTKWRAVFRIGPGLPSLRAIHANSEALADYAAAAQSARLVPIVEPEVLMDGDHDADVCSKATEAVLTAVFAALAARNCRLEAMVLKPNMVTSGATSAAAATSSEVADCTIELLRRCVPEAVPGIAFLSGGQTGEEACANLNAMTSRGALPWELSFSFGRALQYPALEIWGGEAVNVPAAQAAFLHRARMSSLARSGAYSAEAEHAPL